MAIEINGISNVVQFLMNKKSLDEHDIDRTIKMLDLAERYFIAHDKDKNIHWHDVRDNPTLYPNLRELVGYTKQQAGLEPGSGTS